MNTSSLMSKYLIVFKRQIKNLLILLNQKGETIKSELKEYLDEIEGQIDLRYELAITSLNTFRIECKSKLTKFKADIEK